MPLISEANKKFAQKLDSMTFFSISFGLKQFNSSVIRFIWLTPFDNILNNTKNITIVGISKNIAETDEEQS